MGAAKAHLSQSYEFGPYRLTPGEHRLYRNGEVVLLPPKEFDLLLLLVSNSGQVMDRERLIKALWPTTVVEEANLNVHISALRKALAENSGEQQYIETLPRLGYRFIVPVREVTEQEKPPAASFVAAETLPEPEKAAGQNGLPKDESKDAEKPDRVAGHRSAAVTIPLWSLVVILIGLLTIVMFKSIIFSPRDETANLPMNIVPLTTYPGRELQPAFSPDGNQVAFVWSGEKENNTDIYVRLVDGGNWVRLTTHSGDDVNPTWSPDGRTIAFYRSASDGDGIFLVPSLGGAERKLTGTWANRFGFGIHTWLSWSPDGKWLVIGDKDSAEKPFALFLISPITGDRYPITSPPPTVLGDASPAFSPDSRQLAFVRVMSAVVGEVYLVPVDGGEPKRLTFDRAGVSNLAWTPDGQEIVFSSRHAGKSRLLRVPVTGGSPQWLAATGNDSQYPAFSRQGNRLAWMQNTDQTDIFKIALKGNPDAPGRPAPLIVSTANEVSPRYSPNGKKIVFVSTRSGSDEIWICDSDGQNPIRVTSFRGPLAGSPSWSPDGKQIVFDCRPDGNADIFVVSSDGGQPRRLTIDSAEDIVPSWSRDGKSIYFTSNRSGRLQVWKMPAAGGDAVQMTKQGGFEPVESADGEWLYFTQDRGSSAIWKMPAKGGEETALYDFHQKNYSRMWAVVGDGIYFAVAESPTRSTIKFFNSSTENVRTVAEVDGNLPSSVSGFVVSPDGEWLLFPLVSQRGSDLMMLENFR